MTYPPFKWKCKTGWLDFGSYAAFWWLSLCWRAAFAIHFNPFSSDSQMQWL